MSQQKRFCGIGIYSFSCFAILLYIIDKSIAQLDGYVPGDDYPVFTEVPKGLSFTCNDKIPGYYADTETMCQVWHWCVPSIGGNVMYSFVCAPGTVFNQRLRVCDWFYKVDCQNSPGYYGINEDLYKDETGNYIAGKK
ncbi:U-scoloptoxin(01)-Cw1a-like [Achroia grisella]|uniref:U-scoloptoxin(01)-Cw1a-like n=1 Tax=Achroia grisella TaxID=688607 RepID=UPI0027D30C22|nr:U-scoloptoxin(01)-Cw1a-like [Achroia grisella]